MTTTQTQTLIQELMRRPLERILSIGITGSGKSYQWLLLAKRLKPIGAKFRVVDTDNDIDFMLRTQFPELLPENSGNVYVCPAYNWPEYEKAVKWIQQVKLTPEQLGSMDKYLQIAYKTPMKPIDWVVVDKSNNAWSTVQSYFVGEVFGEDTGEYFLQIRKKLWAAGDIGKSGKKAVSTVLEGLDGWKDWCHDPQTEILTEGGWKKYNEVRVGDRVLVLDEHLWKTRWEPVLDLYVSSNGIRKMVHMSSLSHDSLSTLSHRWIVESRSRHGYLRRWRTSETLKYQDRIPMCLPPEWLPKVRSYSDELVEIVAWYVTEGSRTSRRYPQGTISQSVKNEGNVERIREALVREFGDIHERLRSWGVVMFDLPYSVMQVLDEIAPNKCPTYEFLLRLTEKQLKLFVDVCILGDGSTSSAGQKSFVQNRLDVVEAFEFVCALQGIATRTWLRHNDDKFGSPDYYQVSVLKRKNVTPVASSYKSSTAVREIVDYEGIIWCPVTPSGTWLAKRRGTVYFTGNSVINKLYDDWINPIVYRVRCHVYATADVDSLDKNEKDPEVLSLYGDLRIKATGQKKIGGQMHTMLLLIPGKDRWLITTVKDRSGRKYFEKTPLTDLYTQYLFAKANWPLIESEE